MNVGGKVLKLEGTLTVAHRTCGCCGGANLLKLLDDESNDIFYCNPCFSTNCECNGKNIEVVEK